MAVLTGKLAARRKACAPLAGKSTLSRLEHAPQEGPPWRRGAITRSATTGGHRAPPGRHLCGGPQDAATRDGDRSRCDRQPASRPPGGPLLPRLLRLLLLSAAVRVLRSAPAGSEVAASQHRCGRWQRGGGRAHRGADPRTLAGTIIVVRADSGFCRDNLMSWCEENGVHFVLGLARNERLVAEIASELAEAASAAKDTAGRRGCSRTSRGRHGRAGRASGASSPRQSGRMVRQIHASSSRRFRPR